MDSTSDPDVPAGAPPYAPFFGIMGASFAMIFSGQYKLLTQISFLTKLKASLTTNNEFVFI